MAGARLMVLLVLPCLLFSTCNAEYKVEITNHTLKAFRRQGTACFLKAERIGDDGPFNVSFTGRSTGPGTGTEFLLKKHTDGLSYYTIHPADWPEYMLVIDGERLVAKKAHNSTAELTDKNYQFLMRDHRLLYLDDETEDDVTDVLTVIVSRANGRAIKSSEGGQVVWNSNWRDCGTWIYISP